MKKLLFAGSFNPFTIGHKDIVERALLMAENVVIGIGYNEHKQYDVPVEKRVERIRNIFRDNPHVCAEAYTGLTASYARSIGADALIRGIRNISDFEYERNIADVNREVLGIETIFLMADPKYSFISASMLRELSHNGHDISEFLP